MFRTKSIRLLGVLIASLVPASLTHAAAIVQGASINSNFAFTATGGPDYFIGSGAYNSPIQLPEFNPAAGTLTSVQLVYTVVVNTSTLVYNSALVLQPPFFDTPVPDPVQVVPTATTIVALYVGGVQLATTAVPDISNSQIVQFGEAATIASVAVTNGSASPNFLLSSFSGLGLVPLTISTQDFLTLNDYFSLGEPILGTVSVYPSQVTVTGDVQAFYTYTPLLGATLAPEPAYGTLSALVFAGVFLSGKRKLLIVKPRQSRQ
jgi:hypothetical protein